MAATPELPQHVLDTRYLEELNQRILPPEYGPYTNQEQEETTIEKVGYDIGDAAANRYCDCDPEQRGEEGFDEDSDEEDLWFCTYRSIEDEYKMHVVLEQARLDIKSDPTEFPKDIYEEIVERCKVENSKILGAQVRKRRWSNDQSQISPPPSTPCGFPPFSLQHLPPEILVEIALLAQASNPHAHITLSRVDTRLRAFVNSTPLLWSRVDLLYPLRVVQCYLEHSAEVLLRVTALPPAQIGSAYHPWLEDVKENENKRLKEFLCALRPHRHRILSLRLRSDDLMFDVSGENEDQLPVYDFLWDGSMVGLELLDLELSIWTWEGTKVFRSYHIKELHLHGSWTTDHLPLFTSSLKSLVITDDRAPFSKIFNALQAAPRLISLTLRDMSFTGIGEKKGSVLSLDHLESLSLLRIVGSAAEALFSCIVAPNLTSITLQWAKALHAIDDMTDINQLQLFPVPQRSVRHLDLVTCEGGPSFFASVFQTFPGITHLRIASSNLSDEHLLPLAVRPSLHGRDGDCEDGDFETACPNLKHVTIDNEFNSITDVIRLIASPRHTSGIPLESVTLRGIPSDHDVFNGFMRLNDIIPKLKIGELDSELDVYGDSDDCSISATSSEGDWASGDDEVLAAFQKVGGDVNDYLIAGYLDSDSESQSDE
ncbi:hypothetical protein M407DRAFT_23241 [Tulasnella calospora MUT 4182]|uniref:F-box domain-containing protein n=1 Tax=Tulasnella calospora MUT 4182 TaxID=1051891 RepID=A0A0C3QAZ8_9AGAM|nr:hypothetical protein M407DRAFT_23241 [Tulasnella calospora MUT 4182]